MARIVTVYTSAPQPFVPVDMSYLRWLKISQALASYGHQVDIATNEPGLWRRLFGARMGPGVRRVPLSRVRWEEYDVVKTFFHFGYETLQQYGGVGHPFIISKLGSVVDAEDRDGIYFRGERRAQLFRTQQGIAGHSRYVTVLTEPSRARWIRCFGDHGNTLLVPGAVDEEVPRRGRDPFPQGPSMRCLFAGNVYDQRSQPEANIRLTDKMNALGELLMRRGSRLYVIGPGDTSRVDASVVTCIGPVSYQKAWDYMHFAHVGIVLALGDAPNENESTKIYHYLRVGLPTVCESGFPNQHLVREAQLGAIVDNDDMQQMAAAVAEAACKPWNRRRAVDFILAHHTWRRRAQIYDALIRAVPGCIGTSSGTRE